MKTLLYIPMFCRSVPYKSIESTEKQKIEISQAAVTNIFYFHLGSQTSSLFNVCAATKLCIVYVDTECGLSLADRRPRGGSVIKFNRQLIIRCNVMLRLHH